MSKDPSSKAPSGKPPSGKAPSSKVASGKNQPDHATPSAANRTSAAKRSSPAAARGVDGRSAGLDDASEGDPRPVSARSSYPGRPNRANLDIFLMRHGSAGTRRANPKLDVKRPLDKDGKRDCLQLAQVLNNLRISFDLIVSSPLKRCLQTAQLVGTEMGYEAKILHAQALEPGAEFSQFQRLVHESRNYENVLMVGHNPNLTAFLGQLIAVNGNREHSHAMTSLRLRKGSIARITVERGTATLKWLLDPRLVRALYATSTKSSRRKTSRK